MVIAIGEGAPSGAEWRFALTENQADLNREVAELRARLDLLEGAELGTSPGRSRITSDLRAPFLAVADALPVLIWMADGSGLPIYFNQYWLDFTGRSLAAEIGFGFQEGMHPEDRESFLEVSRNALKARAEFRTELRVRRYDGEYRWLVTTGAPRLTSEGEFAGFLGCCADITERKRAEESLRENSDLLQAVIEGTTDVVYLKDRTGRYRVMSSTGSNLDAGCLGEIVGETGQEGSSSSVGFAPDEQWVMATGSTAQKKLALPVGTGTRIFHVTKVPHRSREGKIAGVIGTIHDVTEQTLMEQELRDLQSNLAHVGRLSTLGEMSTAFAHELNQPLSAISTYTATCVKMFADDTGTGEAGEILEKVRDQAQRAGEIIRRWRDFVRKRAACRAPVHLPDLIHEVVALVSPELGERDIDVTVEIGEAISPVSGDAIQLQQVLVNLIRNGVEAIREVQGADGRIKIDLRQAGQDKVEICVSDSGAGFGDREPEECFEAFFSTKPEGIGIGLSICRTILDAHGGRLHASHHREGGATFVIELPSAT